MIAPPPDALDDAIATAAAIALRIRARELRRKAASGVTVLFDLQVARDFERAARWLERRGWR